MKIEEEEINQKYWYSRDRVVWEMEEGKLNYAWITSFPKVVTVVRLGSGKDIAERGLIEVIH